MEQTVFGGSAFLREAGTPNHRRSIARRFPAPWRIVEIPNGFAVDDATGQQLCVFYGRADPNTAGHTGFLTMDEARQMAANFARLPELLKRTSRSRGHRSHASVRNTVANTGQKDDPKATRAPIGTR
jgi:hypothetical protein